MFNMSTYFERIEIEVFTYCKADISHHPKMTIYVNVNMN